MNVIQWLSLSEKLVGWRRMEKYLFLTLYLKIFMKGHLYSLVQRKMLKRSYPSLLNIRNNLIMQSIFCKILFHWIKHFIFLLVFFNSSCSTYPFRILYFKITFLFVSFLFCNMVFYFLLLLHPKILKAQLSMYFWVIYKNVQQPNIYCEYFPLMGLCSGWFTLLLI